MTPKLSRVVRLDSLPLNQTYFTDEGYLIDRPIVTSTGIFEYINEDGSVRRELRLPEDVFDADSLKSYKGKPIIITHDAGLVDKNNVRKHQIGTVLCEGYRSGDDVRAEIIIHDTDSMKSARLKELSLGYDLDLEEKEGEWNGQHYDAIQHNIRINHLALVREARAGEQARLNIDGRDNKTILKGEKVMSKEQKTLNNDGVLAPEEFAKAIEAFKARRAQRIAKKADAVGVGDEPAEKVEEPEVQVADSVDEPVVEPEVENTDSAVQEPETEEEKLQMLKDRRDRRDEEKEPETVEEAMGMVARQDEDIDMLFDIIDTLLAKQAYDCAKLDGDDAVVEPVEEVKEEPEKEDSADEPVVEEPAVEEVKEDGKEGCKPTSAVNTDSVDEIVRQRIELGMIGRSLNMDGLERMSKMDAQKAIIKTVRPTMNLDGKSEAYVNAVYDCAMADIKERDKKDTDYQKKQMFNKDSKADENTGRSASEARQAMIDRQNKKEDK